MWLRNKKFKKIAYLILAFCLAFQSLLFITARKVAAASITITSPTNTSNIPAGPITVTGTAQPSKNVRLYANNALVGTGTVNGGGNWSISATLPSGPNTLRADLYDDPIGVLNTFKGPTALTKFDAMNNSILNTIPAGTNNPQGIVMHPSQPRAYVIDNNQVVLVINTSTHQVITSIDLGTFANSTSALPTGIAISPDGSKVYVSIASLAKVVAINTSNNTIAASASVGTAPSRLAVGPGGTRLYVIDGSDVKKLNATTLTTISTIDMTNQCYDIVIDGTDDKALVACDAGTGSITELDLSNDTLGTSIIYTSGSANANDRMAIMSDDSELWIGSNSDDEIQIFDPGAMASITQINAGVAQPRAITFTPDNAKAYVASRDGSDNIRSIDTTSHVITNIAANNTADGTDLNYYLGVANDGSELFVARAKGSGSIGANDVISVSTSNGSITHTVTANYNGYSLDITNDGTKAYITGSCETSNCVPGTVSEVDLVSNVVNWSVFVGDSPVGVTLNPSETKLYVADSGRNNGDVDVKVVDIASRTVTKTIGMTGQLFAIAYNQANNKVYVGNVATSDLQVIDATTDTLSSPVTGAANTVGVAISPDGSKVYASSIGSPAKLYVIDASTDTVLHSKNLSSNAGYDVLSNNAGTKVYIASPVDDTINVYNVDSDSFDTAISGPSVPFGLGITPDDSKLFVTNLSSSRAVSVIDLSDNTTTSFNVNGYPSAFGNFITQILLASTSVSVTSSGDGSSGGSLANTGQRVLWIPLLSTILGSSLYLAYDWRTSRRANRWNSRR